MDDSDPDKEYREHHTREAEHLGNPDNSEGDAEDGIR